MDTRNIIVFIFVYTERLWGNKRKLEFTHDYVVTSTWYLIDNMALIKAIKKYNVKKLIWHKICNIL